MPVKRIYALVAAAGLGMASLGGAGAADLRISPTVTVEAPVFVDPANRFEARFGVFAHGMGSVESSVAVNGELVSPRLFTPTGPWAFLSPRVHVGGFVNVQGKTNLGYAGLLWTVPIYDRFFAEGFIGGAIHDGSLAPLVNRAGLGCDVLFHVGGSLGYRLNDNWSVMATFSHFSNGRSALGRDCGTNQGPGRNQGLNQVGGRINYTF